jgi:hypothetical protein
MQQLSKTQGLLGTDLLCFKLVLRRIQSKCDGQEPHCSTCIVYRSQCHYDKLPSLAYVRSLEAKVEKLMNENARDRTSENGSEVRP